MIHPFASAEAQETEQFVQSALDALSAHIAILDRNGEIVGVNKAWRRFGDENMLQDPDYCLRINYLEVCERSAANNASDAYIAAQGIRRVIDGIQEEFSLEYPCHGNGFKRWFLMNVTRFDWEGQIRVVVAHQNVTEIKRIQVELRQSKKRTEVILNNVVNGIFTLNLQSSIESANPAACEIFGYPDAEAMIGIPFGELFDSPLPLNGGGSDIVEQEQIGIRRDGSTFPAILSTRWVVVDHQTVVICIVQDVSERKLAEEANLAKERLRMDLEKERELRDLKNRFIAMMSHELRTPLTSIMLSGDMLKYYSEKASDEEKQQYLGNIQTQVDQLTDLIQDVMTISKEESPESMFQPERLDMVALVHAIVTEFQMNYWQSHDIRFESEIESLNMMADVRLMRRIFNNLLSNAIKYSPEGGEVLVSLSVYDRELCIAVKDNGIGIPQEDQQHLFEPFHRAQNVKLLDLPGTGLGLMITRQAVELHQGRIDFESQEGIGTTIRVLIPINDPAGLSG
jgi:PAS domain S-box-containing protein